MQFSGLGSEKSKGQGSIEMRMEERAVVKISQTKNRKKKSIELEEMEDDCPAKRQALGDVSNLITIPVEAALQPHRIL